MLRVFVSMLAVTLIPLSPLTGVALAASPDDSADALAAAWNELPLRVRAGVFTLETYPGEANQPPAWLGFGKVEPEGGFCGFGEDGRASMRVTVRWATRRATTRALARIDRSAHLEGGIAIAHLTRAQILAVAVLPGVVAIAPDGCSWPSVEPAIRY